MLGEFSTMPQDKATNDTPGETQRYPRGVTTIPYLLGVTKRFVGTQR
jgi:hypothetical protein